MDRALVSIYLECLEFDRRQLAQTRQDLLDYRQAQQRVAQLLAQLHQHPEIAPHLQQPDPRETQQQELPVYLDYLLRRLDTLIQQGFEAELLRKVRHALLHALPRLWIPEELLLEQLGSYRKQLISNARLFNNPKLLSLWPGIKQNTPEVQAERLLAGIEASLAHYGTHQIALLISDDPEFNAWVQRSAKLEGLEWVVCKNWQDARYEAMTRPPSAVVFCLRSDQPLPDGETLSKLAPAEIIAVIAGFDLVNHQLIPEGVTQVLEAQWVNQLLPLWLQRAMHRHWQERLQQTHDFLTDLPTPLGLYALFRQQQKLTRQINGQMSLVVLSAQPFHTIESEHGPYLASQWIKAFHYLLQAHLQKTDLLARWSPDKFIVLMPHTRLQSAINSLEKLSQILSQAPSLPDLHPNSLLAGVVPIHAHMCYEEALFKAHEQLQLAQRSGTAIACDPEDLAAANISHVMLLDDDPITLEILHFVFSREGYKVTRLDNGTEVFAVLQQQSVSLLILDLHMPGMNGFEVLEAIRQQSEYDDLPIVMLTSSKEEADIERGFALGANDYLFKPFSPTELFTRTRRFLR